MQKTMILRLSFFILALQTYFAHGLFKFVNDPDQRQKCRTSKTQRACLKHDTKCYWESFQQLCNEIGYQPLVQNCNVCSAPAQVDGEFSAFGPCTKTCGGGIQTRTCTKPAPANGGAECEGNNTRACNTQNCPAVNLTWISTDIDIKTMKFKSSVDTAETLVTLTFKPELTLYTAGAHVNNFNKAKDIRSDPTDHNKLYPYIGKATESNWDDKSDFAFHPTSTGVLSMIWACPINSSSVILSALQGYREEHCGSLVRVTVKNKDQEEKASITLNGKKWIGDPATEYDMGVMNVGDTITFVFDRVNDSACDAAKLRFKITASN